MNAKTIVFLAAFALVASVQAASKEVVTKLSEALKNEYAAAHRYDLFAKKADAEGYAQVAKLFRAAQKAENIHRQAIAAALSNLGETPPEYEVQPMTVGATSENLTLAIKGESAEAKVTYPMLLKQLKAEKNTVPAIRIIQYALEAEKQHAKLFKDALANLGKNKDATYYICPLCSFLAIDTHPKKCRGCKKEKNWVVVE